MPTTRPAATTVSLNPSTVLFDLDGTISDSGTAITSAIAETLADLGYPALTEHELLQFVGPPIADGFRDIAQLPDEVVDAAVAGYRERYLHRMYAPVYPGMPELVRSLHARGIPLALATSKRRSLAVQIIEAAGLTDCFLVQCGATEDGSRSWKEDIVEDALASLREAGIDMSRPVMVGDRDHDVNGASAHDIASVYASWGYGNAGEHANATAVAADVEDLAVLLGVE